MTQLQHSPFAIWYWPEIQDGRLPIVITLSLLMMSPIVLIPCYIHLFIHSFVRSFIHSFVHSFLHSFIPSFSHSARPYINLCRSKSHDCTASNNTHIMFLYHVTDLRPVGLSTTSLGVTCKVSRRWQKGSERTRRIGITKAAHFWGRDCWESEDIALKAGVFRKGFSFLNLLI